MSFWRLWELAEPATAEPAAALPKPEKTWVTCSTCGVHVEKTFAKTVTEHNFSFSVRVRHFCADHAPAYSTIEYVFGSGHYYAQFEVSQNGTPIGYVPAKGRKKAKK